MSLPVGDLYHRCGVRAGEAGMQPSINCKCLILLGSEDVKHIERTFYIGNGTISCPAGSNKLVSIRCFTPSLLEQLQ